MMVTKYKRSILFYSIVLRPDNIFTKKFEGTWPSGHDNPKHLFFFLLLIFLFLFNDFVQRWSLGAGSRL